MKKALLLLMCLCFAGCGQADNSIETTMADVTDSEITTAESTSQVAEESERTALVTTVTENTTTKLTTAALVTTVTENTTAEQTTAASAATVTENTTTEQATAASVTTVTENTTTEQTTAASATTVTENTTAEQTTAASVTTITAETTAVAATTAKATATTKADTTKAAAEVITETEATATLPDDGSVIVVEGKVYRLTFEDDFNGTELDKKKWERCPKWDRQDLNNKWDDDMSYLDGEGNLIIAMSYDEEQDKYLSGGVRTRGRFEQAYGYFEIRCTVNTIPGYWTAFWLMGDSVNRTANGGRDGTEIDIMETAFYETGEIQNTLNWDGYGTFHKAEGQKYAADVYDGEYHTFSLLWTEDEYVFYVDGEVSWRTDAEKAKGTCEVPLYMKITSEMGSWTAGVPDASLLPDHMKVDYVRVYEAE